MLHVGFYTNYKIQFSLFVSDIFFRKIEYPFSIFFCTDIYITNHCFHSVFLKSSYTVKLKLFASGFGWHVDRFSQVLFEVLRDDTLLLKLSVK